MNLLPRMKAIRWKIYAKMIRNYSTYQQGKSEGFDSCDWPSNLTQIFSPCDLEIWWMTSNKANLRDLIAATGLVILLKLDSNRQLISPCDLEIWWMTLKNNKASLLYYIKICASFQIHRWIQTGVTVRKRSIRVKIGDFFVQHDLEIWWMTLKNNRAPFLYYIKLCVAFQSHWYIQTGVTVQKLSIWVKISDFFVLCDLENWRMTLKNNRAPLLCCLKLVHHFIAIVKFKLEFKSGNTQGWGQVLVPVPVPRYWFCCTCTCTWSCE